jgi:hypothetical protein
MPHLSGVSLDAADAKSAVDDSINIVMPSAPSPFAGLKPLYTMGAASKMPLTHSAWFLVDGSFWISSLMNPPKDIASLAHDVAASTSKGNRRPRV